MAQVHPLPAKSDEPEKSGTPAKSELVALPFVDLKTVVKTVNMLRSLPDQSVLDSFNRRQFPGEAT